MIVVRPPSDCPRLRFDVFMHWLCARYKCFYDYDLRINCRDWLSPCILPTALSTVLRIPSKWGGGNFSPLAPSGGSLPPSSLRGRPWNRNWTIVAQYRFVIWLKNWDYFSDFNASGNIPWLKEALTSIAYGCAIMSITNLTILGDISIYHHIQLCYSFKNTNCNTSTNRASMRDIGFSDKWTLGQLGRC